MLAPVRFEPLSPATLHILLALAAEDRHGYGIIKEVARQSQGSYRLGPGTLYDNLQKLLDQGIVDELPNQAPLVNDRRRYYRLSASGRKVLQDEIHRLETIVHEAKPHLDPLRAGGSI